MARSAKTKLLQSHFNDDVLLYLYIKQNPGMIMYPLWVQEIRSYQNVLKRYLINNKATVPTSCQETSSNQRERIAALTETSSISSIQHHHQAKSSVCVISIQVKHQHWAPSAKNRSPEGNRHQSNQPLTARRENSCHTEEPF